MDHLHQIGPVGPPENAMFEGWTMLAAIAARTSSLTLGLLVGSVTYRNPALEGMAISLPDVQDLEAVELAGQTISAVFPSTVPSVA